MHSMCVLDVLGTAPEVVCGVCAQVIPVAAVAQAPQQRFGAARIDRQATLAAAGIQVAHRHRQRHCHQLAAVVVQAQTDVAAALSGWRELEPPQPRTRRRKPLGANTVRAGC